MCARTHIHCVIIRLVPTINYAKYVIYSDKHRLQIKLFYLIRGGIQNIPWAVFIRVYLELCAWPVAIFTMDQRKEQRVCIKFSANLGKSAETLVMTQQAFRDQILSRTQVFQRHARFKTGRTSVDDDKHTGRPTSCTTPETVAWTQELVCQDRHCWGGNWLWEMPTGSDERIGHAPCRSFTMTMPHSHFRPHPAVSGKIQNDCHPPPTTLPWFGTLWLLPISKN
jgi:hypothetical protein